MDKKCVICGLINGKLYSNKYVLKYFGITKKKVYICNHCIGKYEDNKTWGKPM